MFTEKIKTLQENDGSSTKKTPSAVVGKTNAFIAAAKERAARTVSGNGAAKFSETSDNFVTEFGILGKYKEPRSWQDISSTMSKLWAISPILALKLAFFIRLITRTVSLPNGERTSTTQRGQGLKHEGIVRMMWIAVNHPNTFWKNINFFVASGSWHDIIKMLSLDLQYHGWKSRELNWDLFGKLILAGLENPNTSELVKKYLPTIRTNSRCKTLESQADNMIGKWICSLLYGSKGESSYNYMLYRKNKSSGSAHKWQQLISQGKMLDINFNTVHGRALSQLVSGKFLKNNGLESVYTKWIESQPIAKYTGYPYELTSKIATAQTQYQVLTINSQFMGLVETAKKGANSSTGLIVVRDTSASMKSAATGTSITCYDVAKSLALFFSYMLPDGHFANSWIEFNSDAKFHTWQGSTPVERWRNDKSHFVGGTNFQSVIGLLCRIKKQGVPESDFPSGILCISDSEFNPTQLGVTNVAQALISLKEAGFSEDYISNFKIVLWNLQNRYYGSGSGEKFETHDAKTQNVFYFSGLNPATVAFLTGVSSQEVAPKNAEELFESSMNQELLNMLEI